MEWNPSLNKITFEQLIFLHRILSRFILRVIKYCLIVACVLCWFSCDTKDNKSSKFTPKQLTSDQVLELLDDAAVKPFGSSNFHVFYKEYLNDSTWVLYIVQNDFLGNESLGVCEVLDFNGHKVFIYDQICNTQLSEDIKSKNGGPFQHDGTSLFLLVEKRNGLLGYFTLKRRFKFNSRTEPIDSTMMELNE